MPVDPDVADLLQLIEASGFEISTGSPEEARNALAALMVGLRDPALAAAGIKVEQQQFAGLIHGFYGVDLFGTASIEATRWINARLKELLA